MVELDRGKVITNLNAFVALTHFKCEKTRYGHDSIIESVLGDLLDRNLFGGNRAQSLAQAMLLALYPWVTSAFDGGSGSVLVRRTT